LIILINLIRIKINKDRINTIPKFFASLVFKKKKMILEKSFFASMNAIINLFKYNKNSKNDKMDLTKIKWGKYSSDNKNVFLKLLIYYYNEGL